MVDEPGAGRDKVPLSALNHYAYCPRRCYLIHAEGEFEENVHTLGGQLEHARVDNTGHAAAAGVRTEYSLPIWSDRLRLSGRCDAVEFHPDGSVYPVEYKHGARRRWLNDDLQVAAQAVCLEEMLHRSIPSAAIYHRASQRRRKVTIDEGLRRQVEITVQAVHALLAEPAPPPPTDQVQRCRECSLRDVCAPDLVRAAERLRTAGRHLFEPDENEA
jgi:CRISPR-associated exonuclease Cas4